KELLYAPGDRRWGLIYTLLDRFTLYIPDHLVAVSQKMCRQIAAHPGLSTSRVTMIRNGIDCESYYVPDQRDSCRSEFGLTLDAQVVGYAGRIEKVKRLDLLLEGFSLVLARHPEARLMIIGEGKLRPRLEALAARLGISHCVIWTGFRGDIPRLLAAMDIYVQPSANEGFSLSLLEAMAAGKAIVATDVGGAPEVVIDGRTGVLIPPASSSAISLAVAGLLDDPERQSTLGQAARSHVVREFGVRQTMDGYRELYEVLALQP
ncbi:MAG: glycosyltransferase, partial [Candidatus Binatia bacterium]